jgi:hypothetical protein
MKKVLRKLAIIKIGVLILMEINKQVFYKFIVRRGKAI